MKWIKMTKEWLMSGLCNRGSALRTQLLKDKIRIFKSGSGRFSIPYVHCSYIANKKKGLQSLKNYFGRVSVSKSLSLAIGGRTLFIDPYGQISLPQIEEDVYKTCNESCFEIIDIHLNKWLKSLKLIALWSLGDLEDMSWHNPCNREIRWDCIYLLHGDSIYGLTIWGTWGRYRSK